VTLMHWEILWSDPAAALLLQALERGLIDPDNWRAQLGDRRHLTDREAAQPVFIKRYPAGGLLKRLRARLGRSASRRAAHHGQMLAAQQIPTAAALLIVRNRRDREELLISEALDGPDLAALWRSATPEERQGLLQQAATLLGQLHRSGLVHDDSKWQNFVQHRGGLRLIDLDGLRSKASLHRRVSRDIARFVLSAEAAECTRIELRAFLQHYAEGLDLSLPAVVGWALPRLQQLRARHQKRYRTDYPYLLP
jgi:tRNA A-37 threonylcarbamoyl transferase component Bud32